MGPRGVLETSQSLFRPVELSPVCPLGTASVLSPISQDWIVSTIRNSEVVSDSTNVLAVECAVRRRDQKNRSSSQSAPVHLAASHRLLRGQKISPRPGVLQHFRIFSLCSAGRDPGNLRFETETISLHIGFFLSAFKKFLGSFFGSPFPTSAPRPHDQRFNRRSLTSFNRLIRE
jgi:hypothetical protein